MGLFLSFSSVSLLLHVGVILFFAVVSGIKLLYRLLRNRTAPSRAQRVMGLDLSNTHTETIPVTS